MVCSETEEEVGDGRNRRLARRRGRRNRRPCRRFGVRRINSFGVDDNDDEAHLLVASAWRGEVCSGAAMARWRRYCGVFLLRLVTGKGEKGWGKKGSGGAREGEGLGFSGAGVGIKVEGSRWGVVVRCDVW
jgi:hypothetical protein